MEHMIRTISDSNHSTKKKSWQIKVIENLNQKFNYLRRSVTLFSQHFYMQFHTWQNEPSVLYNNNKL